MRKRTTRVRWIQQSSALLLLMLSVGGGLAVCQEKHDKQAEGMALVTRGIELTDLSQTGPYRLHNTLVLLDEVLMKAEIGEETIFFVAQQQWRRELHIKNYYDETAIFVGSNMYRRRSLKFTPPAGRMDFTAKLRRLPEVLDYEVLEVKASKLMDVPANCVHLREKADRMDLTWCFDAKSGLPIWVSFKNSSRRIEFSDYKPFKQHFVPATVEEYIGGKLNNHASTEVLEGLPNDVKAFDHSADFEIRPWCDRAMKASAISFESPSVPQGLRSMKGWSLWYEVSIDTQGRVTNLVPMLPNPFIDRIVVDKAREWRFKPAMCGDTPVPSELAFDVENYNYRNGSF